MTGLEDVVEHAGFAAEARRSAGLADRDRAGCDLRAFHPREMDQFAVGVDDGNVHLPVPAFWLRLRRRPSPAWRDRARSTRRREYRTASLRVCRPPRACRRGRRRWACANVGELTAAMAQAARVIETMVRIIVLPVEVSCSWLSVRRGIQSDLERRPLAIPAIGDPRRLQRAVRLLLRGRHEDPGARLHLLASCPFRR